MPSLKSQRDFLTLRECGSFFHATHWLAINLKKNEENTLRWAWTISRKCGNSVTRNRLKRWGRENVRELKNNEIDINFIFKAKNKDFYKNLSRDEFNKAFHKGFEKLHSFTNE